MEVKNTTEIDEQVLSEMSDNKEINQTEETEENQEPNTRKRPYFE